MPEVPSEVTTRGERKRGTEYWLSRVPEFRAGLIELARQVPGNGDYPFLASPPGAPDGSLTRWDWFVDEDFDQDLLEPFLSVLDTSSPLLDQTLAASLQGMELLADPSDWLIRTDPFVLTAGRRGGVRYGVFNWTTDREKFIEALLGRSLPTRPRYRTTGPVLQAHLHGDVSTARETLGFEVADAVELYGQGRDEAAANAKLLRPVVSRLADLELGSAKLQDAVMMADLRRWADSPLGRLLLPVARGAPRWRSPRLLTEWAAALDIGIAGVQGVAMWPVGGYEFRKHRRAMAAHLRYLFDQHVAPWNRWADDRRRREGFLIFWRDRLPDPERPRPTMAHLANVARVKWPDTYRDEPRDVTVRRMYRLGGAMTRRHSTSR